MRLALPSYATQADAAFKTRSRSAAAKAVHLAVDIEFTAQTQIVTSFSRMLSDTLGWARIIPTRWFRAALRLRRRRPG